MKIQDMKFILEIVNTGSISMAAKNLYISQPALSQCVKKVEQELGTDLFIRHSGKMVKLTKAGLQYADMARQITGVYDSFLKTLDVQREKTKNKIRIGIPARQGSLIMTALLSQGGKLPSLNLEFLEGSSDEQEQNLMNGVIDLAIIRLPLNISNLNYKIVFKEPLGIWLRKGSPYENLAVKRPGETYRFLSLKLLKDEIFALPPEEMRISQTIRSLLKEANITPQIMKNYQNMKSILLLVQNGLCSTIGKQPRPGEASDRFFWIDGCKSTYNLALVYLPETPYRGEISMIERVLKDHLT